MPIVLIATSNPGKLREYRRLFEDVPGARVVSPNDIEIWVEVAETGDTFEEISLEELEKRHILRMLNHTDWNKSQAATILQIERSTLDRKIKAYGLRKEWARYAASG